MLDTMIKINPKRSEIGNGFEEKRYFEKNFMDWSFFLTFSDFPNIMENSIILWLLEILNFICDDPRQRTMQGFEEKHLHSLMCNDSRNPTTDIRTMLDKFEVF